MSHTYNDAPCPACGDRDGCHVPGKVRRSPPLRTQGMLREGEMGPEKVAVGIVEVPANMARYGQSFPEIVCLIGSTRFGDAYAQAMREETLEGNIVLTVGLLGHAGGLDMEGPVKKMLDELHLRKIDMCHRVRCLNVGGYVGSSTRPEIAYATAQGKPIRYLEAVEREGA